MSAATVTVVPGREDDVAGLRVRRSLPMRSRRTVGAWCFADHMGPADVDVDGGIDVGPHPHIGLHTVTWLLDGEVLHRDSLGSEQVIRPGQLNLMTAGRGVAHAEESTTGYRGTLEGIQLWVAQPESTRLGPPAFEHHGELPMADVPGGVATILVGELAGAASPARHDTELVGIDLDVHGACELPLDPWLEYAVIELRGRARIQDQTVAPGTIGVLAPGADSLDVSGPARLLLLGGEPLEAPVVMWWNYVARSKEEIAAAHGSWLAGDDRFGAVRSARPRMTVDPPPWARQPGSSGMRIG